MSNSKAITIGNTSISGTVTTSGNNLPSLGSNLSVGNAHGSTITIESGVGSGSGGSIIFSGGGGTGGSHTPYVAAPWEPPAPAACPTKSHEVASEVCASLEQSAGISISYDFCFRLTQQIALAMAKRTWSEKDLEDEAAEQAAQALAHDSEK